jgi:DNA-binding CsgD family transcriptional regulator
MTETRVEQIIRRFKAGESVSAIRRDIGGSWHTLRKSLIDAGLYNPTLRLENDQRLEVAVAMYKAGKTYKEICRATKASPSTLRLWLTISGLEARGTSGMSVAEKARQDEFRALCQSGLTANQIAVKFGMSANGVRRKAKGLQLTVAPDLSNPKLPKTPIRGEPSRPVRGASEHTKSSSTRVSPRPAPSVGDISPSKDDIAAPKQVIVSRADERRAIDEFIAKRGVTKVPAPWVIAESRVCLSTLDDVVKHLSAIGHAVSKSRGQYWRVNEKMVRQDQLKQTAASLLRAAGKSVVVA